MIEIKIHEKKEKKKLEKRQTSDLYSHHSNYVCVYLSSKESLSIGAMLNNSL